MLQAPNEGGHEPEEVNDPMLEWGDISCEGGRDGPPHSDIAYVWPGGSKDGDGDDGEKELRATA